MRLARGLTVAALVIAGCGSAEHVPLPTGVRATLVRVATADGATQALTASATDRTALAAYTNALTASPDSLNMTATGGAAVLRLLQHDHAASVYTYQQSGFSWDASTARVTHTDGVLSSARTLTVTATFDLSWHIHAARGTGASAMSGAADTYSIVFSRQSDGSWQLTSIRHTGPPV